MATHEDPFVKSFEDFAHRQAQLESLGALVQAGVLTEAQMSDTLAHTFGPRQLAALQAIDSLVRGLRFIATLLTALKDPDGQVDEELLLDLAELDQAAQIVFARWAARHGVDMLPPGGGYA